MTEDEALAKLDRVMRHETTLHRQIDTSVKMLARELPKLFEGRVREDLIRRMNETERTCKDDPYLDQWVTEETRRRSALPTAPPSLDLSRLDTAPTSGNCQNEPAPRHTPSPCPEGEVASLGEPEGVLSANCQNEPAPLNPLPREERVGGLPGERGGTPGRGGMGWRSRGGVKTRSETGHQLRPTVSP